MDNFPESVMVALLPTTTDWCRIELPHMTLVYAGEIKDLEITSFNELAKDASMLAMLSKPLILRVTGVEVFGDWGSEKVNVLRLQPSPELWSMRRAVERWNASEYPFRPHCTIGPVGVQIQEMPRYLSFNRILVGWGKEKLTFELNSGSSAY
jgi:2'-5' RNA ligase